MRCRFAELVASMCDVSASMFDLVASLCDYLAHIALDKTESVLVLFLSS